MSILVGLLHGAHLLGVLLWIGSLFVWGSATSPGTEALDPIHRGRLVRPVLEKTSRLGWTGLVLVLLTGTALLFYIPFSLFTVLGRMILFKWMVTGVMIGAFAYGHLALFGEYRTLASRLDEDRSPEDLSKIARHLEDLRVSITRWYRFVACSGLTLIVLVEIALRIG